jgi:hypothetical protein
MIASLFYPVRKGWLSALLALTAACAQARAADVDWLIVPGERIGAITSTTSEAELRQIYGDENVTEAEINIGEGESETGTVLFDKDPERRIEILWNDPQAKSNPAWIKIDELRNRWRTAEGIAIGTSLHELERMNGRPFTLTGFGWDYSGTVADWNDGTLEKFEGSWGRIILRLYPEAGLPQDAPADVWGDKEIASDQPSMQKLDPKVYEIIMEFAH